MTLPLLVEPELLHQHLGDKNLLIVDLCGEENWLKHHLPGAVHVTPSKLVSGVKPATGKLPGKGRLTSLFKKIGLNDRRQVVAYDDEGGGWAGRFIWTLDVIGHRNSSLLNGGLVAWFNEGYPVTAQADPVEPCDIAITINPSVIAEKEDVLKASREDDTVIWDARSPEEYAGYRVAAARGGHVPSAVNLDWLELMDRDRNLRLREDLDSLLADRGIDPAKKVITHCQTHHRSGLTYFVGKLKRMDIRAYHGSWSEWGNDPETPVNNPAAG